MRGWGGSYRCLTQWRQTLLGASITLLAMNARASTPPDADPAAQIRAIADTCVKCGLCIERCPSYRVLQREQDSPRGRIALADAMARGQLSPDDPGALAALDRCLNCGTCTRVCPADVDYARLIDLTRATFPAPQPVARRGARWLTRHRNVLRALRPVARVAARSALLRRVLPNATPLRDALAACSAERDDTPVQAFTPAIGPRRGSVALFRGCVAGVLDADTQQAAVRVLVRLGFDVHAPGGDHCCGAFDRHHGYATQATERAGHARTRYRALPVEQVLGTVTGCHAQLRDAVFAGTSLPFDDLFGFLDRDAVLPTLSHRPVPRRVMLHVPCTQRDVQGDEAAVMRVLARIPDLDVVRLPEEPACCGAAGTYFVDHPQVANALRAERVTQIEAAATNEVLTSNVGCRMHLAAGLIAAGSAAAVVHPITLLDLSLRESAT